MKTQYQTDNKIIIQGLDNILLPDRFKITFETCLLVCAFDDNTQKKSWQFVCYDDYPLYMGFITDYCDNHVRRNKTLNTR